MNSQYRLKTIQSLAFSLIMMAVFSAHASNDEDNWSLGSIGGTFRVQPGTSYLEVKSVESSGPGGLAGLQVGDYIYKSDGKTFGTLSTNRSNGYKGSVQDLAIAIELAEATDGALNLTVLRSGVGDVSLNISLPVAGAFGPAYPLGSQKFDTMYQWGCANLHSRVTSSSTGRLGYNTGIHGLILIAHPNWNDTNGAKPYRLSVDKLKDGCLSYIHGVAVSPVERLNLDQTPNDGSVNDSDPNDQSYSGEGLGNWTLATAAMYLAEYRRKTGDSSIDSDLQIAAEVLANRIHTVADYAGLLYGRMGHGGLEGHYGNGALNIINAHTMTALGMLKGAGVDMTKRLDPDSVSNFETIDTKFQASWSLVSGATNTNTNGDSGAVGYMTGGGGAYDSMARTAGVAFGMESYGDMSAEDQAIVDTQKDYVWRQWERMQHAHAYTAGGVLLTQFVLPYLEDRQQRYLMENQKFFYHFSRNTAGTLSYFGGRFNNGGDGTAYLYNDQVAIMNTCLAQAIASGNLHSFPSVNTARLHAGFITPALTWPSIDARYMEATTNSVDFSNVNITDFEGTALLPADYTATWSHVSGPATATFTSPNTAGTTVDFPQDGTYRIQLEVVKGGYTLTEPIEVVVNTVEAPAGYRFGANQRIYTGIDGGVIPDLTVNAKYPSSPDVMNLLTSLDIVYSGSDYGQRVSGYIVAPTTGDYTFYVAGDDAVEFRFNSAGTDPAGASPICSTTTWTDQYEWTQDVSQTSAAVTLTAGQIYYYELLHKQNGGGVHTAAAWTGPGIATPTVISGEALLVVDADSIVTQPSSQTTTLGGSATMTVTVEGEGPYLYEWFLDGSSLGASPTPSLSLSNVSGGHVGDYYCVITSSAGTLTSITAALTISDAGVLVEGGLWRDQFDGISGDTISDLTSNSKYPRVPTSAEVLNSAESDREIGDSYGSRWTGWLKPDVTGNFKFYLASDDSSELWLSTDDQPANKVLLTSLTNDVLSRNWDGGRQSAEISLTAGQNYYIEVLHKEGGGSDYCAVAWQKPGEGVPADGSEPISGQYLSYLTGGTHGTSVVMPPVFDSSSYAWSVDENATTGTSVGTVITTDINTPLSYAITAGNEAGKFSIDSSTGEIAIANTLDFETTTNYTLTIQVTNSISLIGQVSATMTVNDIYDAQFIVNTNFEDTDGFTGYSGHATLTTTTDNLGVQWSTPNDARIWNNPNIPPLGVQCLTLGVAGNPSTAEISIPGTDHGVSSVTFDYASFSSSTNVTFALSYRIDGGAWVQVWSDMVDGLTLDWQVKPWTSATVEINQTGDIDLKLETTGTNGVLVDTFQVKDNRPNVAPVANDSTMSVASGVAGLSVGFVDSSDANVADPQTFAITAGNSGEFSINALTGEIMAVVALDEAVVSQYILTVSVTDSLGLSDTATVTVDVTPYISDLIAAADTATVQANATSGAIDVLANDTLPTGQSGTILGIKNTVISYQAGTSGTPDNPTVQGWSEHESEDGNIATGNVTGLASANDNGSGLDAWVVTDNTAATEDWLQYRMAPASAQTTSGNNYGWVLETKLRFIDDFGEGISTQVEYGNGSRRFLCFFDLDASGDLTVQLWGDGGGTYTLTTGGTGNSAFHDVLVHYDPATATASFWVDGVSHDGGTWSGELNSANGVEWGNESSDNKGSAAFHSITWSALEQSSILASGAVASVNGGNLGYDPNGAFDSLGIGQSANDSMTYVIVSGSEMVSEASVTMTINGVNDAPVLDDNSASLTENVAIGSPVVTVVASDPDPLESISYVITAGNVGNAFDIDPNSGAIVTLAILDFETTPSYTLTITGTDSGGLADTATVTVTVTDVQSGDDSGGNSLNDNWEVLHFGAVGTVSATTDSDDDGLTVYQEMVFGCNPNVNDSNDLPVSYREVDDGGTAKFEFKFRRPQNHAELNVSYQLQTGNNLESANWTDNAIAPSAPVLDGSNEWITYLIPLPSGSEERVFVRCRVTTP